MPLIAAIMIAAVCLSGTMLASQWWSAKLKRMELFGGGKYTMQRVVASFEWFLDSFPKNAPLFLFAVDMWLCRHTLFVHVQVTLAVNM